MNVVYENVSNVTIKSDVDNKYYCTCGKEFTGTNICPECGAKQVGYDFSCSVILGKNNINLILYNFKNIAKHSFVVKKKIVECNFTTSSIGYDRYDIKKMKMKTTNIEIDYDFLRDEKLKVTKDGNALKTKTAKMKELSYIKFLNYNSKVYSLFDYVSDVEGITAASSIIELLNKCPEIEILYNTYGINKHLTGIDIGKLHSGKTKPHQILGITKPMLKYIIDHIEDNTSYAQKRYTNIIVNISALYKDKPDIGDAIIKDIIENNIDHIYLTYLKLLNEEKYDRKKLIQYISDDVYTFQGISSASEALRLLSDYIKMSKDSELPYIKYPDSLKKAHDIAMRNYKLKINEIMRNNFSKQVSSIEYSKLACEEVDGYSIIVPNDAEDLKNEGTKLHHCVASYVDRVANGKTKILFMRNKKTPNMSLLTLEVKDDMLVQYKGLCNRGPSPKEMDAIKKWAKNKKLKIA